MERERKKKELLEQFYKQIQKKNRIIVYHPRLYSILLFDSNECDKIWDKNRGIIIFQHSLKKPRETLEKKREGRGEKGINRRDKQISNSIEEGGGEKRIVRRSRLLVESLENLARNDR